MIAALLTFARAAAWLFGLGPAHPEIVECPFPDCGAPCVRDDVAEYGVCQECGGYIAGWLGVARQ
jgi:hypothetical protein